MHDLMWCQESGCWHDLLLVGPVAGPVAGPMLGSDKGPSPPVAGPGPNPPQPSRAQPSHVGSSTTAVIWHAEQLRRTYASNWVPLWCGCCEPGSDTAQAAVRGLATSGLVREAGGVMGGGDTYLSDGTVSHPLAGGVMFSH